MDAITLDDGGKRKSDSLLHRQRERGIGPGGEFPGTRQVIRVDVRLEDVSNRPLPSVRQIDVDVSWQRRIDHDCLVTGRGEIRQATLASPTHLYDLDRRVLEWDFC